MDPQTNRERGRKGFLVLVGWMVMPNVGIGDTAAGEIWGTSGMKGDYSSQERVD